MSDPKPIDFPTEEANSASLALGTLKSALKREGASLAESVEALSEYYNEHRAQAEHDDENRTVKLQFTEQGYRMVAGLIRIEALRRSGDSFEKDGTQLDELIAGEYLKIADLFDEAAREVSESEI